MGRPYDRAQVDVILERMSAGESLSAICREDGMPPRSTFAKWAYDDVDGLFDRYARAKELRAEVLADELTEIADDGRNDWMQRMLESGATENAVNHEHLARSRLRVDTRKWIASKLMPRQFGDKTAVEHSGGMTLKHEDTRAPIESLMTEYKPKE